MRVTFNSLYRDAAAGLERASERLLELQRQVSSGQRVARPSDDPLAASAAVAERAQIGAVEQYTRAANSVASRLTVTDTVLSSVLEKLTAARSSALSAQGSTKTEAQREAAAQAIEGIRSALLADFNTSFHGTYVFAGAAAASKPYVEGTDGTVAPYAGSTTEVSVDIGQERSVTVGFNGDAIARGSDTSDLFAVLADLIDAIRAGDQTAITSGSGALGDAFDRATAAQTRVGAGLKAIQGEQVRLQDLRTAGAARLSKLEDADMAEAITGLTRADAAYQAALGASRATTRVSLLDYLG